MSAFTTFAARMARALVVGATAIGLTMGLAAAPASAAPTAGEVYLSISPQRPDGSYKVHMSGMFRMSAADAVGYMNNLGSRGGMIYRLYGDDDGSNDSTVWTFGKVSGPSVPSPTLDYYFYASPQGISFKHEFYVSHAALNEDDNYITRNFGDEIYGKAIFVDGDGVEHFMYSQLVTGYF